MADHDFEEDFAGTDSGASQTYPMQCSSLRKNGFALLKGHPVKIVEMSTSKTGKHGHAKVHMVGLDIFTGKKVEDICPSTHNMEVPRVTRKEYPIVDIDGEGYFHLMCDDGEIKEDLKITDECTPKEADEVRKIMDKADEDTSQTALAAVIKAMGKEVVKEIRIGKAS